MLAHRRDRVPRAPDGGRRLSGARVPTPRQLVGLAVAVGWLAVYFAWRQSWLGLLFGFAATALVLLAIRRRDLITRRELAALSQALAAAAARSRELERLRHLAGTLLAGTDLTAWSRRCPVAADLLEAERRRHAGGRGGTLPPHGRCRGPLEPALGLLIPVDGSLLGWAVTQDDPLVSDDMAADPRSFNLPDLAVPLGRGRHRPAPLGRRRHRHRERLQPPRRRRLQRPRSPAAPDPGRPGGRGSRPRLGAGGEPAQRARAPPRTWSCSGPPSSRTSSWPTCRTSCARRSTPSSASPT